MKRFPSFTEHEDQTKVEMLIELKQILHISEVDNEITFKFSSELRWRDPRLEFNFLKDNEERNVLGTLDTIWVGDGSYS